MQSNGQDKGPELEQQRSLETFETLRGPVIRERADRFPSEARVEAIVRLASLLIILAGIVLLARPAWLQAGISLQAQMLLAAVFISTGLGLFAFATRGFRSELRLLRDEAQIRIGHLNGFNTIRVARHLPMTQVEGITVEPSPGPGSMGSLLLNLRGRSRPVRMLGGRIDELEALRKSLLAEIGTALSDSNKATRRQKRIRLFARRPDAPVGHPRARLFARGTAES